MKIKVIATGYYDTSSEKFKLLRDGDVLKVSDEQGEAPCKSKENNGVWCEGGIFVETENYTPWT